jgi:hypothetical protein
MVGWPLGGPWVVLGWPLGRHVRRHARVSRRGRVLRPIYTPIICGIRRLFGRGPPKRAPKLGFLGGVLGLPGWVNPYHHPLPVKQALPLPAPAMCTEPCCAVRGVPLRCPVESGAFVCCVGSEALAEESVEVDLAQWLRSPDPPPGNIITWPRLLGLLGEEPLQDVEDFQRRVGHVVLPLGSNDPVLFLYRRPVLLTRLQPKQRFR